MVTRKAAASATPVLTVTVTGDHWKIKQVTTFKTYDEEFDVGVEQEKATADGRKVKVSTLDRWKVKVGGQCKIISGNSR